MESYWTVVVPHVEARFATEWHPTDKEGPFATLTRGSFGTEGEAVEWGRKHLGGTPYSTKFVSPES